MKCLLQSKISFAGIRGWEYILIDVKKNQFIISQIDQDSFFKLRKQLQEVSTEQYDSSLGYIYTTPGFKEYINKRKKIKQKILKSLDNEKPTQGSISYRDNLNKNPKKS